MSDVAADGVAAAGRVSSGTGLRLAARQLRRNPAAMPGLIVMLVFCLTAVLATHISPHDLVRLRLPAKLLPPSAEQRLGTDHFGRDVCSRLLHGARISLSVGLLVIGFAAGIAVPIGSVAGLAGGGLDNALRRLMDAMLAWISRQVLARVRGDGVAGVARCFVGHSAARLS